nr:immunoglobulin heavy chain junction region [Macaca mulatta]MOV49675.1 immunoglobulin heavy chain junction region [Macaca mulatta]MOV49903.1 immunoglobulin heavy chain junction region [Macaca mulatta]MOV50479.1 immunoglobulin heavy chain junction region [Macaca mulatta]MOV52323.1 immunoglobulin heavy chain junction region [Macaca mulatta]
CTTEIIFITINYCFDNW